METLYGRLQVADSSNQYNPYTPGSGVPIMDSPCTRMPGGQCMSRLNHRVGAPETWIVNPPPEDSGYLQSEKDRDIRANGLLSKRNKHAVYPSTVGVTDNDMSRGHMILPSASDMPIVRKVVMFDTRYRDFDAFAGKGAQSVQFTLSEPLNTVSRIAVQSARVPICLSDNLNLQAEDYVMLSVGINLPDRVDALNMKTNTVTATPSLFLPPNNMINPPHNTFMGTTVANTFSRGLAYIPLNPMFIGSSMAGIDNHSPPFKYYTDFLNPISSLEKIELSWWRFGKTVTDPIEYIITPPANSGENLDVNKNAFVELVFYCKTRRTE